MIACGRCGKDNQDHYKFCLGCGAELKGASSPPLAKAPTEAPAAKIPAPQAKAPAPVETGGTIAEEPCPTCGKMNPSTFKFCGGCGNALGAAKPEVPAPSVPSPAMNTRAQAPADAKGRLVLIRPDGSEGEAFELKAPEALVGRNSGALFANDMFLSPKHAIFRFEGEDVVVEDQKSLNGVYLRIPPETLIPLRDGDIFRIGQEIIQFNSVDPKPQPVPVMGSPNLSYLGRISLLTGRTSTGNAYCVPAEGMHLGRERGDIIFPDDGYVSGLHCRIFSQNGRVQLMDVGSSNGTFLRLKQPKRLEPGSLLLMGQQLFRLDY